MVYEIDRKSNQSKETIQKMGKQIHKLTTIVDKICDDKSKYEEKVKEIQKAMTERSEVQNHQSINKQSNKSNNLCHQISKEYDRKMEEMMRKIETLRQDLKNDNSVLNNKFEDKFVKIEKIFKEKDKSKYVPKNLKRGSKENNDVSKSEYEKENIIRLENCENKIIGLYHKFELVESLISKKDQFINLDYEKISEICQIKVNEILNTFKLSLSEIKQEQAKACLSIIDFRNLEKKVEKIKQELDSQFKYNQNIIESLKKNNKKATNSEVYNSSSDSQFQILKKMIDNLVNSIPDRLPMIIQHLSQKIKKLEDTKFNSTKISLINSEANALKNKVQDMDKHLALLENMNHQNRNKNKDKHQILAMTNRNSNSDKKYYSTKLSNKDKISVKNNGKFP